MLAAVLLAWSGAIQRTRPLSFVLSKGLRHPRFGRVGARDKRIAEPKKPATRKAAISDKKRGRNDMKPIASILAASLLAFGSVAPVLAQPAPAPTSSPPSQAGLETWHDFVAGLDVAGQRMTAKLPDRLKNNPQAVEESYRLLLAATARRRSTPWSATAPIRCSCPRSVWP